MGDRDLRVSDAEREHVGQLLQRAVGLGMLSLGEFTERMDTALASKTRGELNSVLVDLPGIRLVGAPTAPSRGFAGPAVPYGPQRPAFLPGAGFRGAAFHGPAFGAGAAHRRPPAGSQPSGNDVASNVIRTRISDVSRRGRWNVPPTLHLNNWVASVTLDFTEAVMSTQVVEIFVDDFCSTLNLVVPAEATVNLDGLEPIAASVANKVRTGPPMGPLHLVVRGRVRFGSVTAKRPLMEHWRTLLGH
ncbi:DUF1707 domain-containing protein [Nocardia higoensis]|uniref:DUF1707 domain-containing protein n=1 Tax=Nocardia higoensis TaxID=228599 RepID=A0ABS0DDL8_9NOCA|nr:DUF1707 domain-containing protein [Nocardia higoensis]MBF6356573.1 DUF1707 domain-containing protein [Nocardia higoensis]